jgi:glutamine amidotransferase
MRACVGNLPTGGNGKPIVMCELFAMSSLIPTSVSFSLNRLARHGGADGPHRDGWGVAFYAGRDVFLLREPSAASESDLVRYIEHHGPPSDLVISHIRFATFGDKALRNTQPFMRELGGRQHVFAHNGDLPQVTFSGRRGGGRFLPIGETDSEQAFCYFMNELTDLWLGVDGTPPLAQRLAAFQAFVHELRGLGSANLIYSDSDTLFVHAHRRTEPGSELMLPGLFVLSRSCEQTVPDLSGSGITLQTTQQALTLVASVPLTGEDWHPLAEGEVLAISDGAIVERFTP